MQSVVLGVLRVSSSINDLITASLSLSAGVARKLLVTDNDRLSQVSSTFKPDISLLLALQVV